MEFVPKTFGRWRVIAIRESAISEIRWPQLSTTMGKRDRPFDEAFNVLTELRGGGRGNVTNGNRVRLNLQKLFQTAFSEHP